MFSLGPGARVPSALLVAAVAAGCAARAPAPGPAARPTPAPAPAVARAPAPEPEPVWLTQVKAEVAALRGRPFLRPVPFARQTRREFGEYVRSELARELPTRKAADVSRTLIALGMAPAGFDVVRAMQEAFATQVAAYYDTETRAFRVIERAGGRRDDSELMICAHELAHALQDQHFDLEAYQGERPADPSLDDDQKAARRSVVEGEATFIMEARELGTGRGKEMRLGAFSVAGLRMSLTMLAAADLLHLLATIRHGSRAESLDSDERAELEAMERLPPVITLPLIEPYFKGAELVSQVWARGGWAAVDGLYKDPPRSTEQVLHPVEKLLGTPDPPVRIRLRAEPPAPLAAPGVRLLESNVAGELGWRIYFRTWELAGGDRAAAGWGGDRFWAFAHGERTVVLIATTWDTEADADEFAAAYEQTLVRRFPLATAGADAAELSLRVQASPRRTIVVERRGRDVDVVDGASEAELSALREALRAADRS